MPIAPSDLAFNLSGGATNTDPTVSLGGVRSTATGGVIVSGVKNNLFPDVTGAQSAGGYTSYRGCYAQNNNGSLALQSAVVYVSSDTVSTSTEIDLAVAAEAMNVAMATIANETTIPAGVTFSHPTSRATGLLLNSTTGLTAGSWRGVWVRRTVTAGAAAVNDQGDIRLEGDSAP